MQVCSYDGLYEQTVFFCIHTAVPTYLALLLLLLFTIPVPYLLINNVAESRPPFFYFMKCMNVSTNLSKQVSQSLMEIIVSVAPSAKGKGNG